LSWKSFNSALLLTSVTAFLYASSTAYTYGYFRVLDLDGNVLDRNFHQIIYHGMILNIRTVILAPLILAFFVTIHSSFKIELSQFISRNFSNGRKLVKIKKRLYLATKKKNKLVREHGRKIFSFWVTALGVLTIFMGLVIFEKQGVNSAEELISEIKKGDFNSVRLKDKPGDESLAYLFCGARNCAVYNNETNKIVYFAQNEFSYFRDQKM